MRGEDDRFTVSLDSSGDHLHKRGLKRQGGDAPIRETLAAAVLMTAGYIPGETLLDPMCGSGTFSLEAAMLLANIPSGWFRDFAFTSWPAFPQRRWAHLRRECEDRFSVTGTPSIFASDIRQGVCSRFSKVLADSPFAASVTVLRRDFFAFSPADITPRPGLVVINPPYGRRLAAPRGHHEGALRICRHLRSVYDGWKFALVLPQPPLKKEIPGTFRVVPLIHGGLRLALVTGRVG